MSQAGYVLLRINRDRYLIRNYSGKVFYKIIIYILVMMLSISYRNIVLKNIFVLLFILAIPFNDNAIKVNK